MLLGSRSRGMIQDGMVECVYIYIYSDIEWLRGVS